MKRKKDITPLVAICIFAVYLAFALSVGGLLTEYTVETWMTWIKGKPVDVSFVACAIASLFLSPVVVPAAVVTWLIFLAL